MAMTQVNGAVPTPGPVHQIVIQFQPSTGAFQVAWPQADQLTKMAMLEGAKMTLTAEVVKLINHAESGIVAPPAGMRVS